MSQLETILKGAKDLFLQRGFKSVTMDQIASELAISKKTIYIHCKNKVDLIHQLLVMHFEQEKNNCLLLHSKHENAIDAIIAIQKYNCESLRHLHPIALIELQKYYETCWNVFLDYKNQFVYSEVIKNLKKGKEQGFYRHDLNDQFIAMIHVRNIENIFQIAFDTKKANVMELFREYFVYHLRGTLTEKGLKHLNTIEL